MSVVTVEYGDEKMRRKFDYYIASPYSHPSSAVRERRFQDVTKFAAYMVRKEYTVFCPITHSHPIQEHGTPGGWEFWKEIDETAIDNCQILYVLCIEGWNESEGVKAEIEYAKKRNMSVWYVTEVDGEYRESNCPPPFDYQKTYLEMRKLLEKRLECRESNLAALSDKIRYQAAYSMGDAATEGAWNSEIRFLKEVLGE